MAKKSLEEQLKKTQERTLVLKRKLEEKNRKERTANFKKSGEAIERIGFDLGDEKYLTGCLLYALEAVNANPSLEHQLRGKGEAALEK